MAAKFLRDKWFYLVLLALSLALPIIITDRYIFQIVIMSTIFAIATLSLNLILGYTGQASLAHAGFFGIGAYGVGLLTKAGLSFWLALPLASLVAALVGFLIGLPTLRSRGHYFAIATLCFGVIVSIVAGNWIELTGGHTGLLGIPRPNPIPVPFLGKVGFETQAAQYYLVLGFLLLTLFVMHRLVYSLQGLSFMAIRNNEALAEAVGINTFATKVVSFMAANFFVGMAGGIYASLIGSISPSTASFSLTFNWIIFLLLGGVATLAGPILGAFAIPVLMEYMQFLQDYRLIIFGVLLIVVIIYFPRGLMGGLDSLHNRARNYYQRRKAGAKKVVASGG
ncbi:MAG: branched-chain amino acid ABC transporter permease [Desulfocucumaceae bacterium]